MFSTAQQAYIDALLPTYAKAGYKYYVVYTNSLYSGSYYSSSAPDLYFVFSKDRITGKTGYTYTFEGDCIFVSVRSGNYSSSSSANNSDRLTVEGYTDRTLTVDSYEHIYTNAEFTGTTLQPNIYLNSRGLNNVLQEVTAFSLLFVFCFVVLRHLWGRCVRRLR